MLCNLVIRNNYDSDECDLNKEFYQPLLEKSIIYRRVSAYFSINSFFEMSSGISELLKNGGRAELVIGPELSEADFNQLKDGYAQKKFYDQFIRNVEADFQNANKNLISHRLISVAQLISLGKIDIKIAWKAQGVPHKKLGIFIDEQGDSVAFNGSQNETKAGLVLNDEDIFAFQSWDPAYVKLNRKIANKIDNFWLGRMKNVWVEDFDNAVAKKFVKIVETKFDQKFDSDLEALEADRLVEKNQRPYRPYIPEALNGKPFVLASHQKRALENWRDNDFQGIMELATGAGKTITSIVGAVKLLDQAKRLAIIVSVPYQSLGEQWEDVFNLFGIKSLKCFYSKNYWEKEFQRQILSLKAGGQDYVCFIVVNDTLKSDLFNSEIQRLAESVSTLFIGDECHHHLSPAISKKLPQKAKFKLGLSATPYNQFVNRDSNALKDFYGDIVAQYSLEDALNDGVLTPYDYHVIQVPLTEDEVDVYEVLSKKIGQRLALKLPFDDTLNYLLLARSRLLGGATNKITALKDTLESIEPTNHSLFYCSDSSVFDHSSGEEKRQIIQVTECLNQLGWAPSRFTAKETKAERVAILENFSKSYIKSLVAIRCLDEGIDIPACSLAFILASTTNSRQFIQRRGRILRKSENKIKSVIYDFSVYIPKSMGRFELGCKLMENELERIRDFARLSLNLTDTQNGMRNLLANYQLQSYL